MSHRFSFGQNVLNSLKKGRHISDKEFLFLCHETSFLRYGNLMTDNFCKIPQTSEEELLEFWQYISEEFPKDKRGLFWKLFMKTYDYILMEVQFLLEAYEIPIRNKCISVANQIKFPKD